MTRSLRDKQGRFLRLPIIERICLVCKKKFSITGPARARRIKIAKFCSQKCHYLYGQTKETKDKIRESLTGNKNPFFGKHHTNNTKSKLSLLNKGKRHTEKTKEKLKNSIKKAFIKYKGENHWYWKGNKVSYTGLHAWVKRQKGKPEICQSCGTTDKRLHWASIDNKYIRDLKDWISLCVFCHKKYDLERNKHADSGI